MSLDIQTIQQFILYIPKREIPLLIQVSKKYQQSIHEYQYLPYTSRKILQQLLEDHKGEATVFMDCKNSFIPKQQNINIRYRQNTTSTLIPPVMPIRDKIVSMNIPIHPKYTIDLSTFPKLRRLTLDIFHEPPTLPSKQLELLRLYFKSSNTIKWIGKFVSLKAEKTYVYVHNPSHQDINEIEKYFPGCIIGTSKASDTSLLNRLHCIHNYIPIENQNVECVSIPISLAFLNGKYITDQHIEKAYVYGKLLSPPNHSLSFKQLYLFNVSLPQKGTISLQNVEKLVVGECHNLLGFDNLESCPLKSFTLTKTTSLVTLRFPSTLTYLYASEWKPLSLPVMPELQVLKMKDCQTFRFLTIPPKVTQLHIEECSKLKKISNLNEVPLKEVTLEQLTELTLTPFPSSIRKLKINNIPMFDLELESNNLLTELNINCCSSLRSLTLPKSIKIIEINNCNDLEQVIHNEQIETVSISMCTSLHTLEIKSNNVKLNYLNQLENVTIDNCDSIELVSCKSVPSFETPIYNQWIMKKVTVESEDIPTAKKVVLENVNYPESSLVYHNSECEVFKVKNMKKIKSIELPEDIKRLSLFNLGITSLSIPTQVTYFHLQECTLTELIIPQSCKSLKLKKCKKLKKLVLPSTLTSIKIKKCPIGILSQCYLPLIPYEVLKSFCYPQLD